MESFGFIITRHISNATTKNYWRECVKCIRKFYAMEKIIIIDNKSIVQDDIPETDEYKNVMLVQSEYPGGGEVLGYYYGWKYRPFESFIVMHDSMFLQGRLPEIKESVLFLWHFDDYLGQGVEGAANDTNATFINYCERKEELFNLYYDKKAWFGCFGSASFVRLEYVDRLFTKYNFLNCLQQIKFKHDREAMERVFALIAFLEEPQLKDIPSLLGNILKGYPNAFSLRWDHYVQGYRNPHAINKVWTGRS